MILFLLLSQLLFAQNTFEKEFETIYTKFISTCPATVSDLKKNLNEVDKQMNKKIKQISNEEFKNYLYQASIAGQMVTLISADKIPRDVSFTESAQECNRRYRTFQRRIDNKDGDEKLNYWLDCVEYKNNEILPLAKQIKTCFDKVKK